MSNNLLEYRTDAGLTIQQLSVSAGVSLTSISRLEMGKGPWKKGPNLLTLKKIYIGLREYFPELKFEDVFPEYKKGA